MQLAAANRNHEHTVEEPGASHVVKVFESERVSLRGVHVRSNNNPVTRLLLRALIAAFSYIAEHSVLQDAENDVRTGMSSRACPSRDFASGITSDTRMKVLEATDAYKLPKPALKQALFDAFFTNLSYCYPIVDRADVESPGASVLLQQAVCLAGSMTRHPNLADSFPRAQAIYEKVKLLICVNFEPDMLAVLKTLCLLTVWSPIPSHIVSLDGPWHATGSALRLGVQMGMHRNSTYANKPDRACRRRLWWLLYASDCLQALIFGRLPVLEREDFDVTPLVEDDFQPVDLPARNFIADVRLASIMGELAAKISRHLFTAEDIMRISESLSNWMAELYPDLRLYDESGRRTAFLFPVSEIHIEYFGTVILSQAMSRPFSKQWPLSAACLVAATCIANLYEEILFRDQVSLLITMHSFWCLTAAIPLIYYKPDTPALEAQRKESLAVICSVVEQLRSRFGVAKTVAHKIERLQRERREAILQQAAAQEAGRAMSANEPQGGDAQQMAALFPQLRAWSKGDSALHNPILEGIARTYGAQEASQAQPMLQGVPEYPISVFDALGTSSFMDIFFEDVYPGQEVDFDFNNPL
ncbi:hypothetical protein NLG97_g2169 [Lecanicillium saksenae]|uniref:Uncharacterized protein n=1 Tax=Lecanicillium saksenae TaxID=468837 RepID=A0ACC1R2B0_9HYPO|nr:hypothetical protein NLG97_g2169 [Lecanicillium saksenae]